MVNVQQIDEQHDLFKIDSREGFQTLIVSKIHKG